eukprot:gene15715-biopygen20210
MSGQGARTPIPSCCWARFDRPVGASEPGNIMPNSGRVLGFARPRGAFCQHSESQGQVVFPGGNDVVRVWSASVELNRATCARSAPVVVSPCTAG